MPFLNANIPPIQCYVQSEFLSNGKETGKLEECYIVMAKAVEGHGIVWEAYIPKWGAMFDKLPLCAFQSKEKLDCAFSQRTLELWDAPSYWLNVYVKSFAAGCNIHMWDGKRYIKGIYLFTIDFASPDSNNLDVGFSENWEEHKSSNILQLENGQYAAQPNNRIRWEIASLVGKDFLKDVPYFSPPNYDWKNEQDKMFGEVDTYFY